MYSKLALGAALGLSLAAAPALAQTAPTAGCTASKAELDANRKAATAFFRPGITPEERTALLDPGYIQHNPVFVKYAADNKLNDYDAFKGLMAARRGPPAGAGGGAAPPPANPLAVVTAECDMVTVVHENSRQVPGAAPGTWYKAYTFDTFRVKNGKLVEHWDSAVLPPAG
ncbi:MAG TPA: hypothetical protein VL460_07415 [Caulobacteraceae bacterium]|jgi:predicted SnoaL-like aldol condensation-catalyzing enzyme|nr:hypothetical protein [Caulobacteraceae bacterium]